MRLSACLVRTLATPEDPRQYKAEERGHAYRLPRILLDGIADIFLDILVVVRFKVLGNLFKGVRQVFGLLNCRALACANLLAQVLRSLCQRLCRIGLDLVGALPCIVSYLLQLTVCLLCSLFDAAG